jgi:hypothetical protein
VGGNDFCVSTVLILCVVMRQKSKIMCTNRGSRTPREKSRVGKPFIKDVTIR